MTKLPKFLPTMQCHVAPLRLSNLTGQCVYQDRLILTTYFLLDELCDVLVETVSTSAFDVLKTFRIPSRW